MSTDILKSILRRIERTIEEIVLYTIVLLCMPYKRFQIKKIRPHAYFSVVHGLLDLFDFYVYVHLSTCTSLTGYRLQILIVENHFEL